MNKVIMMGRFTRDPEIAYGGRDNTAVARFSIAVDKRYKKEGESGADFFNFVAFGKTAEFIEKYFHKGMRALIEGDEEPHVIVADSLYPVGNEDEADAAIASLLNWPLRKPCGFNSANARCVFMIFSGEVRLQ